MNAGRSALLLSRLSRERQEEAARANEFDALVESHFEQAQQSWATLPLTLEHYADFLAQKINERSTEPLARLLEVMPADDLYLAAACAHGSAAALDVFKEKMLKPLRNSLARQGIRGAEIDHCESELLTMLFVQESGLPLIRKYSGKGRMQSWLRSIALRVNRRVLRAKAVSGSDDELLTLESSIRDPELELFRQRYRDQVRSAFQGALATLEPRQRNVLRQYHIDGLTIDQLAALYRVNRSTTARWVAAARDALLDHARARLKTELKLTLNEIDSIIRLIRSQIDLNVRDGD